MQSFFGDRLPALEYNTIKLCLPFTAVLGGSTRWLSMASDPDSVEWVELLCAAVGEFAGV